MELVKHFEANTEGRDFIVGDIHGCYTRFLKLLKWSNFDKTKDRCFSVGDLVDRGPESLQAFSLLYEPWFHAVRGNHEDFLINCIGGYWDYGSWYINGGEWSRELDHDTLIEFRDKAMQLPLAITVGEGEDRFNVLHAEFLGSDEDLDSQDWSSGVVNRMLWGRSLIYGEVPFPEDKELSLTYVGHTITKYIQEVGPLRYIDTGSFCKEDPKYGQDGWITLIEHRTKERWQA